MSTRRQLRARLDRLSQRTGTIPSLGDRPFEFSIDPQLAKAILEDRDRLFELKKQRLFSKTPPDSKEEERILRERIAEKAKTITCPSCYGFKERWEDAKRLELLDENGFSTDGRRGYPDVPCMKSKMSRPSEHC